MLASHSSFVSLFLSLSLPLCPLVPFLPLSLDMSNGHEQRQHMEQNAGRACWLIWGGQGLSPKKTQTRLEVPRNVKDFVGIDAGGLGFRPQRSS